MSKLIAIQVNDNEITVKKGTTLLDIAKMYQKNYKAAIVLAVVDNKLKELRNKIESPCNISFLDLTDKDGFRTYRRSLSFLFIKAIRDVIGEKDFKRVIIQYSINDGYYCDIKPKGFITEEVMKKVKARMHALIAMDIPFEKSTHSTSDVIDIFTKQGMEDKVNLLKYRRASNVNLYSIETFYDYYYGYMVPSTGCLKQFDLHLYDNGVVLQFAKRKEPEKVAPFNPDKKLNKVLKSSTKWGEIMEVENVSALNEKLSLGEMNELILVSEALMEKRIGKIADKIFDHIQDNKFIFIAGPSSSGKTTFAHRLAIQLKAHGVTPHTISVDNYFVNREDTPLDEEGNYNFETIDAIDLKTFNDDMNQLLEGNEVNIPVFDFIIGKREYKDNYLKLKKSDILIIEGIHCLNPRLSASIPEKNKFKIYISALTQLNIDGHNRIPTTDARLIRRIVRDSRYRGATAQKTIGMWPSVRRGEGIHIFPFQEEADVMFNSALVYELAVLKQYVEPLLFNVPQDSKEYIEAKRLIKFLSYFLGTSSEKIPYNSLLREFISGSCFRE